MECQRTNEQTAYPVFYDVEPTEIRNQSGVVREAFAKLVNEEAKERWRDALKEAAGLAGWELKNTLDGHEAKIIEKIVEEISQELRFINSSVDEKLVGMEARVKDVVSCLETCKDEVRMIGIKGMGGAGKTTLARVVFDQISFQFEGSSFVENVRENSKNLSCGLKSLQKQVLSDVLKTKDIPVNGVYEGKNLMKQRMCCKKVLVVLDDVDHIGQLEALAGELSWFKPGSRVIITTREEQVLVAHGVPMNMILDVNLLSYEEANCLFNRYAFGREIPKQSYKELSVQVIHYAAGLPLTIKVLGSFLRGKDELEWIDALERLKTIPLKETQEILELSYNSLEEDYKEIFLDVACILKGWEKERAIRALESCDLYARSGLRVLEQKSLITISDKGYLGMHDHIEEMGKNIVRRLYPNVPYRHSRLWIGGEIEDILVEDMSAEATRCIILKSLDSDIIMKGLGKMKELRLLEVKNGIRNGLPSGFKDDSVRLPNSLRYICWDNYPYACLPENFLGNNLVGLEMHSSNIHQLWKHGENKVLKKLRFMDFSFCNFRTFDLGLTMNLERLYLLCCLDLVELHVPIESCKLKFLGINSCIQIRTLDLARAQSLETLEVEMCEDLVELHMPVESSKLKRLILELSKLKTLNLMSNQNLEILDLQCPKLVKVHMPVENPKLKYVSLHCSKLKTLNLTRAQNLETLNLFECKDLEQLHMPVENFKLNYVDFCRCYKLRTLNLELVKYLNILKIKEAEDLVELHLAIEKIEKLCLHRCSKLKTLDLTRTRILKELHLSHCEDLLELHMPIENPELKTIYIGSSNLRTLYLGLSPYLERLDLHGCHNLVEIHAPVGCSVTFKPCLVSQGFPKGGPLAELHLIARSLGICTLHPDNNFPKFHFECIYKDRISAGRNLAKLISFGLCACANLASLSGIICGLKLRKLTLEGSIPEWPKELDQLKYLEELSLLSIEIEHFPDSIFRLKHLKFLQFKSCWFLRQLPEDIGRLNCLEELHLTDCTSLRDIPNSICEMKHLKRLHLTNCILVEKLPNEIGRLQCLKELHIEGTGITDLPSSVDQLKDLVFKF